MSIPAENPYRIYLVCLNLHSQQSEICILIHRFHHYISSNWRLGSFSLRQKSYPDFCQELILSFLFYSYFFNDFVSQIFSHYFPLFPRIRKHQSNKFYVLEYMWGANNNISLNINFLWIQYGFVKGTEIGILY